MIEEYYDDKREFDDIEPYDHKLEREQSLHGISKGTISMSDLSQTRVAKRHLDEAFALVERRKRRRQTGEQCYPDEFEEFDSWLHQSNILLSMPESISLYMLYAASLENRDEPILISYRELGRIAYEASRRTVEDDVHAKVVGMAMIQKLNRLRAIEVIGSQSDSTNKDPKKRRYKLWAVKWVLPQKRYLIRE